MGRRTPTRNFLVLLPSSGAGCFAKAPTQGKLEQTQDVYALQQAVLRASAGACDTLDLPFHLSWPQAAQRVLKVALTLGGLFVFPLPWFFKEKIKTT